MEPFCVILKRAMASEHPLHQILKYHCRDVTIPNSVGTPALVDDGNFMDQLFAFGNKGTVRLLQDGYHITTWEVTDFRGEIKVPTSAVSIKTLLSGNVPLLNHPTSQPFIVCSRFNFDPLYHFRFSAPPLIRIHNKPESLATAF